MIRIALSALAISATTALAQGPAAWISDPRGCTPFAGIGGDGAVLAAMTADTVLLDFEILESGPRTCRFDTPFDLVPRPGAFEEREATCEHANGTTTRTRFEIGYEDARHLQLSQAGETIPLNFELCPLG